MPLQEDPIPVEFVNLIDIVVVESVLFFAHVSFLFPPRHELFTFLANSSAHVVKR